MERIEYGIIKDNDGNVIGNSNSQMLSDLSSVADFGPVKGKWKAILSGLVAPVLAVAPLAAWSAFIWGGIDPSMAAYAIAGLAGADCIGGAICFTQIRKYFKAVDACVEKIEDINERMVKFMGELAKRNVHVEKFNLVPVSEYTDTNIVDYTHLDGLNRSDATVGDKRAVFAIVEEGTIKAWLMAVSNYYSLNVKGNSLANSEKNDVTADDVEFFLLDDNDLAMIPEAKRPKVDEAGNYLLPPFYEYNCRVVGGIRRRALGKR